MKNFTNSKGNTLQTVIIGILGLIILIGGVFYNLRQKEFDHFKELTAIKEIHQKELNNLTNEYQDKVERLTDNIQKPNFELFENDNKDLVDINIEDIDDLFVDDDKEADSDYYQDLNVGFKIKIPKDATINKPNKGTPHNLSISVRAINSIPDGPGLENKESILEEQAALAKGEFGDVFPFAVNDSKKVFKIGNTYVKSYIVFSRFDVQDFTLERVLVFYKNGYQVRITWDVNSLKNDIMNNMISQNYSKTQGWSKEGQARVLKGLKKSMSEPNMQLWYDTFDKMVETLEID